MATKAFPSLGGPGVDLRKEISQIAHDLHFYGNVFYGSDSPKTQEASKAIRGHAAELLRLNNQIRAKTNGTNGWLFKGKGKVRRI
jgi:hypothetical protein